MTPVLHCSRCAFRAAPDQLRNLCPDCSSPLLVEYDLGALAERRWRPDPAIRSMWRYREVLPPVEEIVTLGEGDTPLLRLSRTGSRLGLSTLYCKDESLNPTRSFKSRGMSAAVTMARALGASMLAAPTAGNAGCALAAYGARAGIPVFVAMPHDTPTSIIEECRSYGAEVELVRGLITDAGVRVREVISERGGFDVSTLREPYRIEGKKTMAYEIVDQLGRVPEVIIYPTGGGTGLIGMWKAFAEMQHLGWIGEERPRLVSVQSDGCAPIVRAFENGDETAEEWRDARTTAWGLRVPKAIGDRLMLSALRESGGRAIAVAEREIERAASTMRNEEGIDVGPEGGAALLAVEALLAENAISEETSVVMFNTGGNKYHG